MSIFALAVGVAAVEVSDTDMGFDVGTNVVVGFD